MKNVLVNFLFSLPKSSQSVISQKSICLSLIGFSLFSSSFAQETSNSRPSHHFSGTITATNNGISLIPSFTLGRPAAFFDLSIGGERLSFDPMLRFGMDGKPWAFVFWGRYKVIKDKRFTLNVGLHPAFIFGDMKIMINGKEESVMRASRFFAGEFMPTYKVSDRFSIGLYYLQGRGFNPMPPRNTNFIALNTFFSNLPLGKEINLRMNPQLYFLRVDENTGTYVTSSFTITKGNFPIAFQTLFNQKIKSAVPSDNFVWNLSLLYNFSNTYKRD
jgi:hypothetical protein